MRLGKEQAGLGFWSWQVMTDGWIGWGEKLREKPIKYVRHFSTALILIPTFSTSGGIHEPTESEILVPDWLITSHVT